MHLGKSLAWLTRKPLNCPFQVKLRHCGEDWDSNNSLGATILETRQDFNCQQRVCFGLYAEHGNPTAIASKNVEACTGWCSPLLSFWALAGFKSDKHSSKIFWGPFENLKCVHYSAASGFIHCCVSTACITRYSATPPCPTLSCSVNYKACFISVWWL